MGKSGMIVYQEDMLSFQLLTMAERGKLITAMIDQHNGIEPQTIDSERLKLVWTQIVTKIEYNKQKYTYICNRNRENRLKGLGLIKEVEGNNQSLTTGDESSTTGNEPLTTRDLTKHNITKHNIVVVPGTAPRQNKNKSPIRYDPGTGKIDGAGEELLALWAKTYPGVDVNRQIELAGVWLMENPRRAKKDLRRFLGNWLRTAQRDADERDARAGCGRAATTEREAAVCVGGLLL